MSVEKEYSSDVAAILSHRYDNGADYWTTPDKRLIKGAPFSTLESVLYLLPPLMLSASAALRGALNNGSISL